MQASLHFFEHRGGTRLGCYFNGVECVISSVISAQCFEVVTWLLSESLLERKKQLYSEQMIYETSSLLKRHDAILNSYFCKMSSFAGNFQMSKKWTGWIAAMIVTLLTDINTGSIIDKCSWTSVGYYHSLLILHIFLLNAHV